MTQAANLPVGELTMLFTDIDSSTWLLQRLREQYQRLLEQHHATIRRALQAHGGQEVETQGDAFFVVFRDAAAALSAAVAAQRALASEEWPGELPVWVRMGLHTGSPVLGPTGYVGLDVHRAARIASSGHGGQILLSRETVTAAAPSLPSGVALKDLGSHRLKDLDQPERLFQVIADGLRSGFPPVRSLDSRPNNLPAQLTPLIGRKRELSTVTTMLRTPGVRLVSLLGAGGTGKSRLALSAGFTLLDDFSDGVFFVALAGVGHLDAVPDTIASSLGLRPTGPVPILESIARFLRDKQILLVIDNFEHVVGAAPIVADLLESCASISVLVTSRVALNVHGERRFDVPPLGLPDRSIRSPRELLANESVSLFVDRAQAVKADFSLTDENAPAVVEICVRLDGLPLAIELAASRMRLLSPAAILSRLRYRLDLLTGGARDAPARHQTMRGAIAWSYGLLNEPARVVFRRLSVFAGGADVEAIEAVCAELGTDNLDVLESLSTLLESSLIQRQPETVREDGVIMLETIRDFAAERLREQGEHDRIRASHLQYYADQVARRAPLLVTREVRRTIPWFVREEENLRAAADYAAESDRPVASELQAAMSAVRRQRGYWISW